MSAVLLSHPHAAAVSSGFAACLARSGKLAVFVTGVAFREQGWSGGLARKLAARRPVLQNRILADLPPGKLRALPLVELGARAAALASSRLGLPIKRYDALFVLHDAVVSRLPWPRETTMVYAYEDGALRTFQRAQRSGIDRVWDLPLPHYLAIEELWRVEAGRWPRALHFSPPTAPAREPPRQGHEAALAAESSPTSRA